MANKIKGVSFVQDISALGQNREKFPRNTVVLLVSITRVDSPVQAIKSYTICLLSILHKQKYLILLGSDELINKIFNQIFKQYNYNLNTRYLNNQIFKQYNYNLKEREKEKENKKQKSKSMNNLYQMSNKY